MLKFENLTIRYGKQPVIDGLSHDFSEGCVTAIIGASGIGKTTLLNVLAGFIKPSQGALQTDHKAPSYIFQEPRLFPWMTALENVMVACKDSARADAMLSRLLPDPNDKNKYPNELSGGMKQRVSIARALVYDFDLLLMDEPFKGLDAETRRLVSNIVFEECRGKTVILVTHDQEDLPYCDHVLRLEGSPAHSLAVEKSDISSIE